MILHLISAGNRKKATFLDLTLVIATAAGLKHEPNTWHEELDVERAEVC
jgi:hypothetical protein